MLADLVAVLAATLFTVPSAGATTAPASASGTGSAAVPRLHWGSCAAEGEGRARFDLVGFDPRGIIRSTPLRCFDTLEEAEASLAPIAFPYTREEERVWIQADRTLAQACAERAGPILNHMSTANVARDMDLLRRAWATPS